MMRKSRIFVVASIIMTVFLAISGCSAASSTTAAQPAATSATAQQPQASDATYVQVQSIDGSTITAVVGTMSPPSGQPGGSGQPQGAQPNQASGSGQPQSTPPDQSPGSGSQSAPSDMPSGGETQQGGQGMPGGAGGMMGFTAGTETITFTLSGSTAITSLSGAQSETATVSDIAVGDILAITLSDNNIAETVVIQPSGTPDGMAQGAQPGSNFGGSDTVTNGTAATTIDTDSAVNGQSYSSAGDDENALRIDGAAVTLSGIAVNKTGGASSSTENGDFYGMNAGLLALNGATVTITDATVTTNAVNGNGVFSYGTGTTVNISDSVIRTGMNNSGGIQTTGGATMNATNLDVETSGGSAAAIRSDRGGGDVNVTGGSYITSGTGSPAIYSTANISVDGATLTANASEAVVVEGKNSVTLNNAILSGNMQASTDENENVHNIMLYQSMSGDAEVGHSSFTAAGGSILANAGDMFYVTNTTCTISLTNVALTLANENLLTVSGNSISRGWGTAGANGGICTFLASQQAFNGIITVDDISSLDFRLADGSVFTGAINSGGTAGTVSVTLGGGCRWVLTADSYITSFTGDVSGIVSNGYAVYVNGTTISE